MKNNPPLSEDSKRRLLEWKDDMHPCLYTSFYETIDCPQDDEDAERLRQCHMHAVCDIDLQIKSNQVEIEMLTLDDQYDQQRMTELLEKKRRLLFAKRRHLSSSNAYWYFMQ